jgi:TonB-linked SusC/RagA family outer membrane protein
VVVIGYGTASKRDLTGSIAKVAGKEVADKPNTNPVASLQGRVAGLTVINNGTPGQAPDIRIRGTTTLGASQILYVVDGILNDNIDYINPNDIESIEILKDPSSLAIFGSRGAGGVVAITTTKAKTGQFNIRYNGTFGFKKLVDKIDWANAEEFKTLYEEEKVNIGVTAPFDYSKWTGNTDWIDAVTRTGIFNQHTITLSGATDKNKFSLSMGYQSDEGLIRHERLQKYLFAFNDELKVTKGIKVGFNLNAIRQKNPYNATFVLNDARKVVPIVPSGTIAVKARNPYGADSTIQNLYYALPDIQIAGVVNPLLQLENEWDKTISVEYRVVASVFAEINFLRDFNFKTTVYGDMSNVNRRQYVPLYNAWEQATSLPFLYSQRTSISEDDATYRKAQTDFLLNYKKRFGEHGITAMAGLTTYYTGTFRRAARALQGNTPIPNDERLWYINNGFIDASSVDARGSGQRENALVSGLFRALYNYAGKYYLNASFRQDYSSQFIGDNQKQNFWAVGGAWEMTRENFMSNQKIFNFLKLKASYGQLGNQNALGFDYPAYPGLSENVVAVFGGNGTSFNIFPAFTPEYLASPDLRWETTTGTDVGFEADLLSSRLHVEASYYKKVTKDILSYVPPVSGGFAQLKNAGKVQNTGVEVSASWNQKISNDLSITVNGNLTTFKNKVLELVTEDFALFAGRNRSVVGLPIAHFYGYIVEGVYQSYADKLASPINTEFAYGPGDLKYKDVNGDGIINTDDRTIIGNPTPDFTYGGAIEVRYKQFNLGLDFNGVYGNEVYREWGGTESPFQRVNYPKFKFGRWHGEGTSNWHPILGQDHRINYESSTYGIEDGSYFRLRNINLGYNLSPKAARKLSAKNLRIYVNIQNLKTFKNNLGYSPEFGGDAFSFGVDRAGGAIPAITTFGVNVTF